MRRLQNRTIRAQAEKPAAHPPTEIVKITPPQDPTVALLPSSRLEAVFALSPFGFVVFDANHCVTDVSGAFTHMTGLTAADVVGLDDGEFSQRLSARCVAQHSFCGLGNLLQQAAALTPPDNATDHIEIAGEVVKSIEIGLCAPAEAADPRVIYFRDITNRIEAERAESLLISSAAHALRTPMTSIFGYSELMSMPVFADAPQPDMTAVIYHNAALMRTLINDYFDLARIRLLRRKDLPWADVQLQSWLSASACVNKPPAGREAPRIEMPSQPLWANVSGAHLEQALGHLLANAWKFSRADAPVDIALRQHPSRENEIGISITDHGIGMTAAQIASVGHPFFQGGADGDIEGCGLGMSIVNAIIRLHRGRLEIASSPGAGSAITIWLPATADSATTTAQD